MAGMRFILLALSALAGALLFVSPAGAAVGHRMSAEEGSAAVRFWTQERAERALRRDPVFGVRGTTSAGVQTRHRPVTVNRPEVGKILGWDRLGGYSCTGTVIDTRSLRLVLTAAHCVYSNGMWSRRMVFIPDFRNGRRPYGTYKVKTAWVSNAWQRLSFGSYGTNFAVAILVTRKLWDGTRIGENVGAIEVESNPNRRGVTDIYGYPGAAMGGRVMRTCRSRTKPDWYGGRVFPGPTGMLARCNMAAGSSGGPWVSRYSLPGGGTVGVVDGLTSTGFPQAGRSYLTSPYFGRLPRLLIRASEGR